MVLFEVGIVHSSPVKQGSLYGVDEPGGVVRVGIDPDMTFLQLNRFKIKFGHEISESRLYLLFCRIYDIQRSKIVAPIFVDAIKALWCSGFGASGFLIPTTSSTPVC